MRGSLPDKVRLIHKQTYAPSVTNIATLVLEDLGEAPDQAAIAVYREHVGYELAGAETLEGTYPFTHARSHENFRLNAFLHKLILPGHRERFLNDFDALSAERRLTDEEFELVRGRKWIGMIRRGGSFFVLVKMAAVIGVSNPELYAAFRGETLEAFMATRKVPIRYSVAGGEKVKSMDGASPD